MALTGYLKIPDIDGESLQAEHEDEIDIYGLEWGIEQRSGTTVGSRRSRARADAGPLVVLKTLDRSSPYIAEAVERGTVFDEVELALHQDMGEAHLDYLVLTLQKAVIRDYGLFHLDRDDPAGLVEERIEIDYARLTYRYARPQETGGGSEVHEVEIEA